jgi:probable HAF family extracellular repeat protein
MVAAGPPKYVARLVYPPGSRPYATPMNMNEVSQIVGYAAEEPYHPVSVPVFVDVGGAATPLPTADLAMNFALGNNDVGLIAGQTQLQPCVWDAERLSVLPVPAGFFGGAAWDASNNGKVVGSYDSDFLGPQHCVWVNPNALPITLRGLRGRNTVGTAFAINEVGQIAGVTGGIAGAFQAVRWDRMRARPRALGFLPGAFNSEARGINGFGDVVGRSSSDDGVEAFLYTDADGLMSGLGGLPGGSMKYGVAYDVNDSRQVVGTSSAPDFEVHAFLWQDGVMYDLNDLVDSAPAELLYLSTATAINNAGHISAEAVVGVAPQVPTAVIALLTPVGR